MTMAMIITITTETTAALVSKQLYLSARFDSAKSLCDSTMSLALFIGPDCRSTGCCGMVGANRFQATAISAAAVMDSEMEALEMDSAEMVALGGDAPEITNTNDPNRPFSVDGNTFTSEDAAKQRSCDIQNNACSDAANSGAGHTLADCQAQQQACLSS